MVTVLFPNNLISGFRKCGVYLNSEAIEILDDVAPAPQDAEQHDISIPQQQQSVPKGSQVHTSSDKQDAEKITDAMIAKFMQRYEKGYDLYDPIYQKGLETNNLVSTIPNSGVENFADVPVLNPLPVTDEENTISSVASAEVSAALASTSLPSNLPVTENIVISNHSNILQKFISPFGSKQPSK